MESKLFVYDTSACVLCYFLLRLLVDDALWSGMAEALDLEMNGRALRSVVEMLIILLPVITLATWRLIRLFRRKT